MYPCGNHILDPWILAILFLLRQFLDFWLMCQVLFFAEVNTAKWNYPGIFGRMNLFNIYIHNGIGLVA